MGSFIKSIGMPGRYAFTVAVLGLLAIKAIGESVASAGAILTDRQKLLHAPYHL